MVKLWMETYISLRAGCISELNIKLPSERQSPCWFHIRNSRVKA